MVDVRDVPVNRVPAEHQLLGDLARSAGSRQVPVLASGANSGTTVNQPEAMF